MCIRDSFLQHCIFWAGFVWIRYDSNPFYRMWSVVVMKRSFNCFFIGWQFDDKEGWHEKLKKTAGTFKTRNNEVGVSWGKSVFGENQYYNTSKGQSPGKWLCPFVTINLFYFSFLNLHKLWNSLWKNFIFYSEGPALQICFYHIKIPFSNKPVTASIKK